MASMPGPRLRHPEGAALSMRELLSEQVGALQHALACSQSIAEKLMGELPETNLSPSVSFSPLPKAALRSPSVPTRATLQSSGAIGLSPQASYSSLHQAISRNVSVTSLATLQPSGTITVGGSAHVVGGVRYANVRAGPATAYQDGVHQNRQSQASSPAPMGMPTDGSLNSLAINNSTVSQSITAGSASNVNGLKIPLLGKEQPAEQSKHDKHDKLDDDGHAGALRGHSLAGLKHRLSQVVHTPRVAEEDLYLESGLMQAIARDERFHKISSIIILCNIVWLSVEVDLQNGPEWSSEATFCQIVDNFFCLAFCIDLAIRFVASRNKRVIFEESWFLFDFVLTAFTVCDTWIFPLLLWLKLCSITAHGGALKLVPMLRILRLLRVARVARSFRLVASMPELLLLARSVFAAIRSVASILIFMALTIYVYAIVFVQSLSLENIATARFTRVPQAMNFLLLQTVCGFDQDFINQLLDVSVVFYLLFLSYIFLTSLTLMNMLVGVLCQVVSVVSDAEEESTNRMHTEQEFKAVFHELDKDGNARLSKTEFEQLVKNPKVMKALKANDIDLMALVAFVSVMFEENEEVCINNVVHALLDLRGDQTAKVKDVAALRAFLSREMKSNRNLIVANRESLKKQANQSASP
eukprot:TRINITY_DN80590_c0_g1_i1.p1 TRINITY_DN80590_c0_g1~~TRINITY_DN80590_c0_g1_i1.p1  ORF type:complete len:669 (-),score=102.42 TRINITY_DN80590_c0_g1_i1:86-2008(-)